MKLRAAFLGLLTVLGLARRGFFIPYRDAARVTRPASYPALEALLHGHEAAFAAHLEAIEGHAGVLAAIGAEPPPAPRWTQDWFPRLDAAAAYTMVRRQAPRRIVEVGSGHSTRFLARAVADAELRCRITTIDPAPRASLAGLDVQWLRVPVQQAGEAPFAALEPGDVLFIDSSHVLMPGTDVDYVLNRVLPVLPRGVLVHVHDVFLPDDVPESWAWRGYNEQLAVGALLAGGGYEPLFASHYVATRRPDWLERGLLARLPLVPGALESSLWLRKTR